MHNKILYKYRSLNSFENFVDIILFNRLYAANYKDLNDPMEGQYYYPEGTLDEYSKSLILNNKNRLRICSLSRERDNPLLWSHYADGSKGVNIGVEVVENKNVDIIDIKYRSVVLFTKGGQSFSAKDVLSCKLSPWIYEKETRVFTEDTYVKINLKEIILGERISTKHEKLIYKLVSTVDKDIIVNKLR